MTKNSNQAAKDNIKGFIIQDANKEKPESAKQLIKLMQERHAMPPEQTTNQLFEQENEDRLYFQNKEQSKCSSLKEHIFSKQGTWYWATIMLVIVTTIAVFIIPESNMPLVYLRSALGTIFLLFLPGFVFIKALFPVKVSIITSSENMDKIEQAGLSLGMSLVLVPIVGLALNYTPWGLRLAPIILSLIAVTTIFATVAVLREYQERSSYQL